MVKIVSGRNLLCALLTCSLSCSAGDDTQNQVAEHVRRLEATCLDVFRGFACESRGFRGLSDRQLVVRIRRTNFDERSSAFTVDVRSLKVVPVFNDIALDSSGNPTIDSSMIKQYEEIASKFVELRIKAISFNKMGVVDVILSVNGNTSLVRLPDEIDPVEYFKTLSNDYGLERLGDWYWIRKKDSPESSGKLNQAPTNSNGNVVAGTESHRGGDSLRIKDESAENEEKDVRGK